MFVVRTLSTRSNHSCGIGVKGARLLAVLWLFPHSLSRLALTNVTFVEHLAKGHTTTFHRGERISVLGNWRLRLLIEHVLRCYTQSPILGLLNGFVLPSGRCNCADFFEMLIIDGSWPRSFIWLCDVDVCIVFVI